MRRPGTGRDVTRLLADFGHNLPSAPSVSPPVREPRLFRTASRRGPRRRGAGWAASTRAPVSVWRCTMHSRR